mmetsp:Transcript_29174/g.68296  ORF Transcript_29174/g.68296 Transcript_29174/m.68296 type:complete len:222 (+) Transcript_29174:365-1030(+)
MYSRHLPARGTPPHLRKDTHRPPHRPPRSLPRRHPRPRDMKVPSSTPAESASDPMTTSAPLSPRRSSSRGRADAQPTFRRERADCAERAAPSVIDCSRHEALCRSRYEALCCMIRSRACVWSCALRSFESGLSGGFVLAALGPTDSPFFCLCCEKKACAICAVPTLVSSSEGSMVIGHGCTAKVGSSSICRSSVSSVWRNCTRLLGTFVLRMSLPMTPGSL